jgi:hypothetical protein
MGVSPTKWGQTRFDVCAFRATSRLFPNVRHDPQMVGDFWRTFRKPWKGEGVSAKQFRSLRRFKDILRLRKSNVDDRGDDAEVGCILRQNDGSQFASACGN